MAPEPDTYNNQEYKGSTGIRLRAGNISLLYENGSVRYICARNHEIIRMVYFAVRDDEWLTVPPIITDEIIENHNDFFRIQYKCRFTSDKIDFTAFCTIEGKHGNKLSFNVEGEALRSFEKNRIGFCVLHPVESTAGQPCTIIHTDTSEEVNCFPYYISPHQPFTDITSMLWNVEGTKCRLDFTGDVFETEDQRNWTDASFKTYSTPLCKPFPVTVMKGEKLSQKVTFRADKVPDFPGEVNDITKITIKPGELSDLPAVGIGRSTRPEPLTDNEIGILKTLRFNHYRADIHLHTDNWKESADATVSEAVRLGYPLELALFFDDDAIKQCNEMIDFFTNHVTLISLIIIYHKIKPSTPDHLASAVVSLLRAAFSNTKIACGTNAGFAELNRNRPSTNEIDFLCYSIHPQEHASNNTTLVENLKGQEYTVRSCTRFSGNKGVWISPVTLRRRFNANLENYEKPYSGKRLPPQVDPRLMSVFGACWTAGSLKYLCEAGTGGVTYFETAGERGIIQGDYPARWPEVTHAKSGMIFPVFHVFRFFLENNSFRILTAVSNLPLKVDAMVLFNSGKLKVLLINFTASPQKVLTDFCTDLLIISQLSNENYFRSRGEVHFTDRGKITKSNYPLYVPPFSLTFIEGNMKDHLLHNS